MAYVALFLSLGGGAYAISSKPTAKTIRGCYSKRTGNLRIALHGRCTRAELAVSWNQQGPAGPAGPAGTLNPAGFYTKEQADTRYLSAGGTAANAAALAGSPPSSFAPARLFGSTLPEPERKGGAACTMGAVLLMAGNVVPAGTRLANGQVLNIIGNETLFALIGTTYGGDGVTNFVLPDLRGAEPKGRGPNGVNYVICTTGEFP